ncbi:hypothetical protein LPC08_01910 [Roseomonas sp. OT10]|uniref:hypothetical protein n=1 Tax=Roseomonas cutis TaxID=2897332 RepID=UPI001E309B9D|nr:hypothetical protein [Roseomonas sp. OT10]UFN49425.1 hypothetical protein LPC08_01910 [Roseomonas sp. OT10]
MPGVSSGLVPPPGAARPNRSARRRGRSLAWLALAAALLPAGLLLPRPELSWPAAHHPAVRARPVLALDVGPLRRALEVRDPLTGRWIGVCRQDLSDLREAPAALHAAHRSGAGDLWRRVGCQGTEPPVCALLEGKRWNKAGSSPEALALYRRCQRMA